MSVAGLYQIFSFSLKTGFLWIKYMILEESYLLKVLSRSRAHYNRYVNHETQISVKINLHLFLW